MVAFGVLLNLPLGTFGFIPKGASLKDYESKIWMTKEQIVVEDQIVEEKVSELKRELLLLSGTTNRGFKASNTERKRARDLIFELEKLNPTAEPAATYYSDNTLTTTDGPSISGKWTLMYTDAPDITGLDTTRNPFSTAKLGRIGQECNPPFVKNVIEWLRPDWADNLPFSGSTESRVLQKVVTSASATTDKPTIVNLKIAGLEVASPNQSFDSSSNDGNLVSKIEKDGLIAGLLSANPIDLKGPLNPPFGQFRILYLDDQFRITLTSQNYVAVNQRCTAEEEWF